MSVDRSNWPLMVQVGLWGLPSRGAAWAFFWLTIALAVGSVGYGLTNPLFFIGAILFFASLWYYLSIRWVDQHSKWG